MQYFNNYGQAVFHEVLKSKKVLTAWDESHWEVEATSLEAL